ncbi:MAG: hypothetical protein GF328_12210 [Candidatus Latescibacteria bacterium]|nr:hypothetical protein [Candidatus Latescibacterota bacterium]
MLIFTPDINAEATPTPARRRRRRLLQGHHGRACSHLAPAQLVAGKVIAFANGKERLKSATDWQDAAMLRPALP